MNWVKWTLVFVVAAIAIWVIFGKKDLKSLGESKPITDKEATNNGRKPNTNQSIIRLPNLTGHLWSAITVKLPMSRSLSV